MDVDPAPAGSKRPADFPSSSTQKRVKILPSDGEMASLISEMDGQRKKLRVLVDGTKKDDTLWLDIFSDVFMHLKRVATNIKISVIANIDVDRTLDIVKSSNETELEAWKVGVRNGVEKNEWNDLLACVKPTIPDMASMAEPSPEHVEATRKSWEQPYKGEAANALWTHIQDRFGGNQNSVYAKFCSIVQSSGMGKSRTVDELGKEHFSIPINLRDPQSTGYPPADHEVRNFLTTEVTEDESYHRTCCFIDALFDYTHSTLENWFDPEWDIERVASEFRTRMTDGQTMKGHNEFRRGFYQEVIRLANDKCKTVLHQRYATPPSSKDDNRYNFLPKGSCNKLIEFLKARQQLLSSAGQVSGKTKTDYPLAILVFDEAHTLTNQAETDDTTWSHFTVLGRVLRGLYPFQLFALFLSTTGKILRFISPNKDSSTRIINRRLVLIQPFTDLGFDTIAQPVTLDGTWNLETVTADSHIVYMGRPLFGSRYNAGDRIVKDEIVTFAVGKLLNADPDTKSFTKAQMLACLSQRLPIEFNSTNYISQIEGRNQVEGHMRVCLDIDSDFETMVTVSSSEPLLSEAAYVIMAQESFDPLQSFKKVLDGFAIHKGDRGEFLALLLLTLARDRAVGPPVNNGNPNCRFFDLAPFVYGHLFRESPLVSELEDLRLDFPGATMHFNHFIKLHDFKSIDKECLLLLMTRGAGVLCANTHPSIDAVNVFLLSGTKLTTSNFGLVLYQIKNDPAYIQTPQPKLLELMNPYDVKILKAADPPVPIIRIFFALAAKTPGLHVTRHGPSAAYGAIVYDIWSAGLSSQFLNPINDTQSPIWDGLLQASQGWQKIYKVPAEELRRSMNPGAANDNPHWSHWAIRSASS